MAIDVHDDRDASQYVAEIDGDRAGFAEYRLANDLIVFSHTEVDPRFEGQGIGSALARFGLDDARRRGLSVITVCPFVRDWMARHPDYQDLAYRPRPSTASD